MMLPVLFLLQANFETSILTMSFGTPNSYLEEQTVQPLSIDSSATAVPVFIGYTEKAIDVDGNNLTNVLTPVGSLLGYETYFGGAKYHNPEVYVDIEGKVVKITAAEVSNHLYRSIDLYFRNGGGNCYILSVGDYSAAVSMDHFVNALSTLKNEEGPTLIVLTDAVNLTDADYYMLCKSALAQCNELKDRFVILDVKNNDVTAFRENIGADNLNYGAAYYPYLNTTLSNPYDELKVSVRHSYGLFEKENSIRVTCAGPSGDGAAVAVTDTVSRQTDMPSISVDENKITLAVGGGSGSAPSAIVNAWEKVVERGNFHVEVAGTGSAFLSSQADDFKYDQELAKLGEDRIKIDNPPVYDNVVTALSQDKLILPPSGVVAAAYSKTDIGSGPWKAPANVIISDVTGPVEHIDNAGQESLNVSPDGKSINAVRSFANQGTLIWGARTLDGNSKEWRYISVRRLFIKVESDVRRSTAFSVFEPNNAFTWLKIKTMLIAYLDELWSVGALNGSTAEEAYFVRVGLGETMDDRDILEGHLNISVGIAAVRPAEFVAMTITHVLREA